jgi:predicted RNA methylase
MSDNLVTNYGWNSSEGPDSCSYISPKILELLSELQASRVLDLGCGNGKLCSEIAQAGLYAVEVEYDRTGMEMHDSDFDEEIELMMFASY